MKRRAPVLAGGLLLAVALAGGCKPACPAELITVEEIVQRHNRAVEPLANLQTRAEITLTLRRPDRLPMRLPSVSGNLLLKRNPDDAAGLPAFLLRGRELSQELFRAGSDPAAGAYYFWYDVGGESGAWWGRFEHLGKPRAGLLMDPTQLVHVLCVLPWPSDWPGPPVLLRAERDTCRYVLQFVAPKPVGGLYVQREVYLDRRDPALRPREVRLYDLFSRVVMIARLSDYQPVQLPAAEGPPPEDVPQIATRIDIEWVVYPTDELTDKPAERVEAPHPSALRLRLSSVQVREDLPAGVFEMDIPPHVPAIQVDAAYDK